MKKCSCCKQEKTCSEFQVRKASKDGLTASCKQCLHARDKERYPKEKARRLEGHKRYMKSESGKLSHKQSVDKWKSINSNRRAAHVILGNAVRDGRAHKLPCFICGEKAEAHHPDYDRPLDVMWLCRAHHNQAHALVKRNS